MLQPPKIIMDVEELRGATNKLVGQTDPATIETVLRNLIDTAKIEFPDMEQGGSGELTDAQAKQLGDMQVTFTVAEEAYETVDRALRLGVEFVLVAEDSRRKIPLLPAARHGH